MKKFIEISLILKMVVSSHLEIMIHMLNYLFLMCRMHLMIIHEIDTSFITNDTMPTLSAINIKNSKDDDEECMITSYDLRATFLKKHKDQIKPCNCHS